MIQSGRALIFIIGGFAVTVLPGNGFFIPAMIVAVMCFLTYLNVKILPEDAGLGYLDTQDATSGDTEKVDFKYVLKSNFQPVAITIAVAEFCTGFVRHGF